MASLKADVEVSEAVAATKALDALAEAAGRAADALERLSSRDHGGVVIHAVADVVSIEIKPKA